MSTWPVIEDALLIPLTTVKWSATGRGGSTLNRGHIKSGIFSFFAHRKATSPTAVKWSATGWNVEYRKEEMI